MRDDYIRPKRLYKRMRWNYEIFDLRLFRVLKITPGAIREENRKQRRYVEDERTLFYGFCFKNPFEILGVYIYRYVSVYVDEDVIRRKGIKDNVIFVWTGYFS